MFKKISLIVIIGLVIMSIAGCDNGSVENNTYSINSTIWNIENEGIEGVELLVQGSDTVVTTDADGNWSLQELSGEITIIPGKEGWVFDPEDIIVEKKSSNLDFTGLKYTEAAVEPDSDSPHSHRM